MGDPSLNMVDLRITNEPAPFNGPPRLEYLPEKTMVKLLGLLDHISLCRSAAVCRRFNQIVSTNDSLWKDLCLVRGFKETDKPQDKSWRWMAIALIRVWNASDIKEGPGTMFFDSYGKQNKEAKNKYVGDWSNNQRNGFGMFIWLSRSPSSSYVGHWKNDLREGYGVRNWPDGNRYVGDYHRHHRHGNGVFAFADGSLYQGKLVNNQFTVGSYRWPNGRSYRGEWKGLLRSGKGYYQWPDGRSYDGEWQQDKRHGKGLYAWNDGDYFEGTFVEGKRAGQGKLHCKDGKIYDQFWKEKIFDEFAKGKESNSEVNSVLLPSKDTKDENMEENTFVKPREIKKEENGSVKRLKEESEEEKTSNKKQVTHHETLR
eukprot:TRINITY_DN3700_c4_g1_i1.p1 TRINITY_DN3700_c4_g1~~TRINITY_DN3700_c4_g1_i1.p1  ORF type:complete len:371 (-),score=103.09 TRINITY_DN3700_c4_g1_i1:154-1266(-)